MMVKFTQEDRELALRVWKAANPWRDLPQADYERASVLGFFSGGIANNLCNDVRHGHDVAPVTSDQG